MAVDFNDPYGYTTNGEWGVGAIPSWGEPTYVGGQPIVNEDIQPLADPIALAVSKTTLTKEQAESMAMKDPDGFRRLLFSIQGGQALADINRTWENYNTQQEAAGKDISELVSATHEAAQNIMNAYYLGAGSRYTIATGTQKEQNELEARKQSRARFTKIALVGAAIGAFFLLR